MPSKPTISKHSTLTDMKAFIRKHKLNHPSIKLSLKKAEMTSVLDKLGHLNSDPKPKKEKAKKEKSKPTPSQIKKSKKPTLKDILLDLDIDVSKKIADAVEEDNKIDFYEITDDGTFDGQDEMDDMRKLFKPDGKKDIFGKVPKWIDGITGGNAGTTGTLTKAKARKIKNKYKKLTIKRFVETDKSPYYKYVDV